MKTTDKQRTDELWGISQVAACLGCSRAAVDDMLNSGKLTVILLPRRGDAPLEERRAWRYTLRSEVEAMKADGYTPRLGTPQPNSVRSRRRQRQEAGTE